MIEYKITFTNEWSGKKDIYNIEVESIDDLYEYLGDFHGGRAPDEPPISCEYKVVYENVESDPWIGFYVPPKNEQFSFSKWLR